MYAVIKAGGKQQKVKPGDVIEVELMHGQEGEITFAPILVVDDEGHTHYGGDLRRAVVKARVIGEQKGDKVKVFKYRPKTGYAKRQGHRQMYTLVEIQDVALSRRAPSRKAQAAEPEPQPEPEDAGAAREEEQTPETAPSGATMPEQEVEGADGATASEP